MHGGFGHGCSERGLVRTGMSAAQFPRKDLKMSGLRSMRGAGFWFALVAGVAAAGGGCASGNHGKVTLRGEETRTFYAQNFNQAYISSSAEGQYDVVLIQDPASERKSAKPKGWKEWALQWPGSASNPG